ncbi:MAG: DNA repair protein RadC [Candidatus Paceibacterota bacterium]|jgi:modification methylase
MTKLKDTPKFDRPREKFLEKGADALSDSELLAILLGSGIKGTNVKVLAQKILKKFGDNFLNVTVDDLKQIDGIGPAKALQIVSVLALAGRLYDKQNAPDNLILSAEDAVAQVSELKEKKQEHLVCLYLNARNALIKKETVSIGSLDKSIAEPREVFALALAMHAAGVILVHNHPSGDSTPSEQDKKVAKRMIEAGKLMGVNVIDFLIIAKNKSHTILGDIHDTELTETEYVADGATASLFDLLVDEKKENSYKKNETPDIEFKISITEEKKNIHQESNGKIPFINQIVCGSAVDIMKKIPSNSVHLIITSPPYNLKNSTGNGMKDGRGGKWANAALQKGYSNHNDNMPHDEYVKWQRDCLTEMFRIIPDDGAIFYNHKWRVQGGVLQDRQDIVSGFPVRQIIIWRRKGGFNFNAGYFVPTYEVIYLIAKPNFKLAPKANGHGDVWEFTQEMNNKHPAAFPVGLIDRIVSSTNAKTVLDPFMGSGTTALSAMNFGRDYIGIDLSPEYCKMAEERINEHKRKIKTF